MNIYDEAVLAETRRQFFSRGARGLGGLALASLTGQAATATLPHFPAKAKRCIYLHMVGAPPQQDLLDYKPKMVDWFDKDLPASIRQGQRLTTMTSGQSRFPIAPSIFKFNQYGKSGAWVSELLPYTAKMVDDIAIIRSMHTEAINHDPAITFIQTGNMNAGKPCIGSWVSYGLGSMNQELPSFVVLNAMHSNPKAPVQAISARLWSAGFLSSQHSGVALRAGGDPVLFINNPDGVDSKVRRRMLDSLGELSGLFPLASAVFMGGTLVRRGGHNILEPAFFAKPVIAGPYMENFAEIAQHDFFGFQIAVNDAQIVRGLNRARDFHEQFRRVVRDAHGQQKVHHHAMPSADAMASRGEASAIARTNGANTTATLPVTASILARITQLSGIGAVATRSGASSPEIASQARPPASWPAAITSTGTSSTTSSLPLPKARHSISAGGRR